MPPCQESSWRQLLVCPALQVQHITGVDLSPGMLNEAAAKVRALSLQDSVDLQRGGPLLQQPAILLCSTSLDLQDSAA